MSSSLLLCVLCVGGATTAACALVGRQVHLAAWQGAAVTADVPANLATVTSEVAAAGAASVQVLLFPEMYLHGYDASYEQLRATALRQDSPELRAVAEAARTHAVCVGIPYCERSMVDGQTFFNSMAVFDATGELVCNYRKVNLWGEWEAGLFDRGAAGQLTPFDLRLGDGTLVRTGCLICFDIEFPEPARTLAVEGAELLLVPTALGAGDVEMTTPFAVVPTRALENHVTIVYCNLEGEADAADRAVAVPAFCGRSAIFDPSGATCARAAELTGGGRLAATIDLDGYAAAVDRNPYLADRLSRMAEGHYTSLAPKSRLRKLGARGAHALAAVGTPLRRLLRGARDLPQATPPDAASTAI